MNDNKDKPEDIILECISKHSGDIKKDKKFDCEDNCPYCNDDTILIKPQYLLPVYDDIQWAEIYKNFKCLICGNEFWEVWSTCADNYSWHDDDGDYCDEYGDYTDSYYDVRHAAYSEDFDEAMKTGDMCLVDALYEYTVIELPFETPKHILDSLKKYQYPIYRSSNNS